jgi:3-oxoacyl-[acyl-carrier protein] reductase
MSLTNKLFSLLGFSDPMPLKRFNGTNLLPDNVLLITLAKEVNAEVLKTLTQLELNIVDNNNNQEPYIESIVIDATNYCDENCYQNLFTQVQDNLKRLSCNARVVIVSNEPSIKNTPKQNTFIQALIGFTKSLAKELGRKGTTVNAILINNNSDTSQSSISANLLSPLSFFLSSKSTFVSGQFLTINEQKELNHPILKESDIKKKALVTGAGQGIGASIASKLAEDGYLVIGVDIEPMKEKLTDSMTILKGKAFILDVSNTTAGEQLVSLADTYNGFDLIVHNAGITRDKTLAKMPEHFWKQTLDINLLSVIRINEILCQNNSINDGGSIVCLSSMNGIAGQGGQTNYACSKAGIIGYVKSMSSVFAEKNITINAVAPGFIETDMTEKMPFFTREMGRRMNALGQGGLPVDVAESVSFLGSYTNVSITGQTLRVCGLNIIGT